MVEEKSDSHKKYDEDLYDELPHMDSGISKDVSLGTIIVHLLAGLGLFLYSYENEFVQKLHVLTNKHQSLATSFNFTLRYIDDVLSI